MIEVKRKIIDETGNTYGWLKVLEKSSRPAHVSVSTRAAFWLCECKCGKQIKAAGKWLRSGVVVSCGCKKSTYTHSITHGMKKTRFYRCWQDMKARCSKSSPYHQWYSDKGITVCKEWQSFENFKRDMLSGYDETMTLDRIDGKKGYCKENCRWATRQQQSENRAGVISVVYDGESYSLSRLCRKLGVPFTTVRGRMINNGLSAEESIGI